ncbi:MAG: TolC family protein, partial [Burkholderiales bacterium]|nr:TolC family protein [Burkholderiales bacterium]
MVMAALAGGCAVAPQPLSPDEQRAQASANRQALTAQQEPIQGPVTLDEAMARAVKYNLDHRVKLLQEALSERDLDLSNFDLLPKLTLQAGYTARNNVNASSSENVANGTQSLVPSTSEDKHQRSADLGFAWNVLDFGVSYYGAKQQADRVLIAQEERRKVLQLLMQQTRQAYWQAAGAQVLEDKVEPILKQAQQALDDSRKIEKENLKAPIESLNYQRQLLDIVRQLESVRDELAQAKPRLASIMNLEPGQRYSLAPPSGFAIPKVVMPVERMEETALVQRPELVQAAYTERIGVLETRKALAKLLPGVEIDLGGHYNSN